MIGYFINTTILLKLYYITIRFKWYKLTDFVEENLKMYNVYIHKNMGVVNVIMLGEWFFDEYYNLYRDVYNDKRYYVLYKLYPPKNASVKSLKSSAIDKRDNIIKRDKGRCLCCYTTEKLTVDHITPISKGGDSSYYNLQTLCNRCNSIKGDDIISIPVLQIRIRKRRKKMEKLKKKQT